MAVDSFLAAFGNQGYQQAFETEEEIKKSLKLAYTQGEARKVFENRLKLSEVAIIFEYKDKLSHGKIPDFRETYNVLDQVTWFKQYPYITRQELMQKA